MAGDSDKITRDYFEHILLKSRYIDSKLPDTSVTLWGRTFDTPIATAALSHLDRVHTHGMVHLARGAKLAGAVCFCGMESYEGEYDAIAKEGAATIRIIKPHENNEEIIKRIKHAKELNAFAVGIDIDHAYANDGTYDVVAGMPMRSKSTEELKRFVEAAGETPFVVKGVLSAEDALKCVEAGVAGIVVSHHHGIMPYAIPPIMALPEIVEAVGGKLKVFVDCCIESGIDAFKALAYGADMVCVGRALMDSLKENGSEGVCVKITSITDELASTMARTGYDNVDAIDDACCRVVTF